MKLTRWYVCLAMLAWCSQGLGAGDGSVPGGSTSVQVLTGELDRRHHQTYLELPFQVPSGIDRLTVTFSYDRADGTVVDLGLADPERFRGWSGGNKTTFTLAETDATPSYLPGPLPEGQWRLVLGVPNLPAGARSRYRAEIELAAGVAAFTRPFADAPLASEPGWYRGDLHLHSGHSDGGCAGDGGRRAPCPLYRTLQAAAARGLDFVAVTDHNTRSHHQGLRELQGTFDRLVVMPGRELTTFQGHANVLGTTGPVDFTAGADEMLRQAARVGGLVVINHPGLPSDARCLGCGWTAPVAPERVHAVEVVNGATLSVTGGDVGHPLSGIAVWQTLLDTGARITAIGASDNHDPSIAAQLPGAVGTPVTVVHAEELSQPAVLEALRRGRAFVDVAGSPQRLLEVHARSGEQHTVMGGVLQAPEGALVDVLVTVWRVPEPRVVLIVNGAPLPPAAGQASGDRHEVRFVVPGVRGRGWLRAEVSDAAGQVLLLSNPVYLNHPQTIIEGRANDET